LNDFQVDTEGGSVLDEVFAVAAVDPDLADGGVVGCDLSEEVGTGHGVLHAGRGDQHGRQQSEGVGGDAALSAHDLLARVRALACGGHAREGLYALRVENAGRRAGPVAFLLPHQLPQ
jgi:hypothetical protein